MVEALAVVVSTSNFGSIKKRCILLLILGRNSLRPKRINASDRSTLVRVRTSVGAGAGLGGAGTLVVARGWGVGTGAMPHPRATTRVPAPHPPHSRSQG